MCGIAGLIHTRFDSERVKNLLIALSTRGLDATGMAWIDNNGLWHSYKGCLSAEKFIANEINICLFRELETTNHYAVLFHCRNATHGSASDINNAHPILVRGRGFILHNGIVYVKKVYSSKGQTDSEQMLRSILKNGLRKALEEEVFGWYAIAYVNVKNSKEIILTRRLAPLFLAKIESGGLIFSSTIRIMKAYKQDIIYKDLILINENNVLSIGTERGNFEYQKSIKEGYPRIPSVFGKMSEEGLSSSRIFRDSNNFLSYYGGRA